MGNIISFKDDSICISNGATDVFINLIALSGSELAKTDSEKRLIVWISEKDQNTIGMGTVGFDISEMIWNRKTFLNDRAFLVKVIENAETGFCWEKLDYKPNKEIILPVLKKFKEMLLSMTENDIKDEELQEWLKETSKCDFSRCKKHNTLLTFCGCQVCNN